MTALAATSINWKRQIHRLGREDITLHKDHNRKCSVEKILVVGLKGLGAKTN
jgi:hypothetical protein